MGQSFFYTCPRCRTLETRFDFTLIKGAETYQPQFICKTCRANLIELEDAEEKRLGFFIRCMNCGAPFCVDEAAGDAGLICWD